MSEKQGAGMGSGTEDAKRKMTPEEHAEVGTLVLRLKELRDQRQVILDELAVLGFEREIMESLGL